jgi:hypothetical protein
VPGVLEGDHVARRGAPDQVGERTQNAAPGGLLVAQVADLEPELLQGPAPRSRVGVTPRLRLDGVPIDADAERAKPAGVLAWRATARPR